MNKKERVAGALAGSDVDRPPFSFWYHFGLQHMPGAKHAEAEIDFYRAYDLDFLKVMSDYPYPLPQGVESLETSDDWKRMEPISPESECWREQLAALSAINEAIGGEAFFIETVFSPWTTARRLARSGSLEVARRSFPEQLLSALDAIASSLAAYARKAIERGASGIFLSLGAATGEQMSAEEYAKWGRPFDLKILEAVRDAPFNVLHIHGKKIHFDSVFDFPVAAINWSHFHTAPSLSEGLRRSGKVVMGGIDEVAVYHLSPPEIRSQVAASASECGTRRLIVAPGCSVPTDTPVGHLAAVREAAEAMR